MNVLERIPTRWLLAGAALACLALWAAPSSAQTTPDAKVGQPLFEDTPNMAPDANLTHTCVNCHTNVQDRRKKISGDSTAAGGFANISYDTALGLFGNAISTQAKMSEFKALDLEQVQNIAAYLADTPKVTATDLSALNVLPFSSAASGASVTKTLTLHHSVATTDNLQITGITLAGSPAFTRSNSCGSTLAPAGTCTFSVTYKPTNVGVDSGTLTVALKQGTVAFNRPIALDGSVAGAVGTPPPSSGSSDSGGGALGGVWLTGLALATAVLALRRRA